MSARSRRLHSLEYAMEQALGYDEWLQAAEELDSLQGLDDWREDDVSDLYHYALVKEHSTNLRKYRKKGDVVNLLTTLEESLYRHLGEIGAPELYRKALAGTKRLITEFLEEVDASMRYICDNDYPGLSNADKLAQFEQAARVYGRPALLMSGGAALGVYNIGVVAALLDADVLPQVISGASMGSFVAVVIGSRSREDLMDLFQNLDRLHTTALQMVSPMTMLKDKVILDSDQLFECIDTNSGGLTFREAFEKSGLVIKIPVSPTRSRQKPRLLNHLTSPDVMIAHASLASCAIPGVFPPVTLMCRDGQGETVPYMGTEKWTDGSVYGDIPVQRMSRLHNVNMSIVSQSNPHVIPFTALHKAEAPRLLSNTSSALLNSVKAQATVALDFARSSVSYRPLRSLLDSGHAVLAQQYHGDINIHLPPKPAIYTRLLTNPDEKGMDEYMLLGRRATWPELAAIRDKTRISRAFDSCIASLRARIGTD
jgi:NTE family protein